MSLSDEQREQAARMVMGASCEEAYGILEELKQMLSEACDEQTEWTEEIDRQNLRKLLDDLEAVDRVHTLISELVDPR